MDWKASFVGTSLWGVILAAALLAAGCGDSGSGNSPVFQPTKPIDTPRILGVTPDLGHYMGGQIVTIQTSGFQDDFTLDPPLVLFGGEGADMKSLDSNTVEAVTPYYKSIIDFKDTWVDLEVRGTGPAQSVRLRDAFIYHARYEGPPPTGAPCSQGPAVVVFAIDHSGSMAQPGGAFWTPEGDRVTGSIWDRAVAMTSVALLGLDPWDEFGIVIFDCIPERFRPDLVPGDPENVSAAIEWLREQGLSMRAASPAGDPPSPRPATGPAIADAFLLASQSELVSQSVSLYSNSLPDCGETAPEEHVRIALSSREAGQVLGTIGLSDWGYAAAFLRRIAEANGGLGLYWHLEKEEE